MNTRVLAFGVLVLILGMVVAAGSTKSLLPSFSSAVSSHAMNLSPNKVAYVPLTLNATSSMVLAYNASLPVGFVLANGSALASLQHENGTGFLATASRLEGKGVIYVVYGSLGMFPYLNFSNASVRAAAPLYSSSDGVLGPGTYYAFFANPANATAAISFRSEAIFETSQYTNETLRIRENSSGLAISSILALLGILIIVISIFLPGRKAADQKQELAAEAERIYSSLGKGKTSKVGTAKKRTNKSVSVSRKSKKR
ncbi:MAG: hypothetical protein ACP5T3_01165 [Candidatus Micrarchaeia archaeon]